MAKRKQKNRIDVKDSIDLFTGAYGLSVYKMNSYQFKIRSQESSSVFDWYHTTGTLMVQDRSGSFMRLGVYKDAESVAEVIKEYVYGR